MRAPAGLLAEGRERAPLALITGFHPEVTKDKAETEDEDPPHECERSYKPGGCVGNGPDGPSSARGRPVNAESGAGQAGDRQGPGLLGAAPPARRSPIHTRCGLLLGGLGPALGGQVAPGGADREGGKRHQESTNGSPHQPLESD
jgi:hypothetical protein